MYELQSSRCKERIPCGHRPKCHRSGYEVTGPVAFRLGLLSQFFVSFYTILLVRFSA